MMINGRTPEEIKRGIKCHVSWGDCSTECPYDDVRNKPAHECIQSMTKDALALIQHLESERDAALAKVPKWISGKDRLPENKKETADCYLVTDGAFIWMAYWGCKEWQFAQCTDSPYVIDWTDITHWMPLPKAPEEEG